MVMIDCEDFGEIQIYTKAGGRKIIDHETTVRLCKQAQEEGIGIDEIIKRDVEPELKTLRFV
ncbi:hypothetical protein OXIME_000659 [Oxyplasma meridianum]|uniref:Uncharacterized protein n=1 Tax=Oxyplasma meridianum TaxID=3073602 RepID=A0AAX4NFQ2_9ARCH